MLGKHIVMRSNGLSTLMMLIFIQKENILIKHEKYDGMCKLMRGNRRTIQQIKIKLYSWQHEHEKSKQPQRKE